MVLSFWRMRLPTKNRLVATEAKFVEVAFQHQLADVASSETAEAANGPAPTPQIVVAAPMRNPSKGKTDPE